MGEIINLKAKRKQRARDEKDRAADANRLKFGRTKSEKRQERLETERATLHLDGHKIDT